MKKHETVFSLCFAILAGTAVVYGCSSDDSSAAPGDDGGTGSDAPVSPTGDGGGDGGVPAVPTIGTQIDRFGRPAVNTVGSKSFSDDATRGAAEDAYNADGTQSGWVAAYKGNISAALGIIDSLDTHCGNQIFADADAGADRYGTLASVLADDRQWLDTSKATCTQYLGVELNATGAIPNQDCGGRKLDYDVIDLTYSALATGGPSGVTDGIDKVSEKTDGTTFPYLAAP